MKNSDYLFCHNLHRFTPIRQRQEIVLPCDLNQAMAVLGLSLEVKQIAQPQLSAFPYRVLATDFRVARLTTRQVAAGSIPDYLNLSANRILRQLEWWLYQWRLFRPLQKLERAIPEVIIELFHVPIYRSVERASRDPANPLAVAHLHFWDCDHHKTYLRLWQGWDDDSTSCCRTQMVTLLQNYLFLIDHLFSAEPTIPDPILGGQASPTAPVPTPDEINPRSASLETSSHEPETESLSHADKITLETASPETILPEPETESLPKAEELPPTPLATPSTKPRFYFKTVYKICQMAVARQQQINRGHVVQGIEVVNLACKGPSKNTLLKVTDLVLNWEDKDFQWDVVTWLHQSTQHTPDEITDLLNKLRLKFKPQELALITSSSANH